MKYKETEFTLRPFNIRTKQAFVKISFEIDKLNKIFKEEIDTSLEKKYEPELKHRLKAMEQLKKIENRTEEQESQLTSLIENVNKVYEEMKLDTEYQACIESINLAMSKAVGLVCMDINVIKPFVESVLIGDLSKLDWEDDWNINEFCQEVLMSFFLYTVKNKIE